MASSDGPAEKTWGAINFCTLSAIVAAGMDCRGARGGITIDESELESSDGVSTLLVLPLSSCSATGISLVAPTNLADDVCNELSICLVLPAEMFGAKESDKRKSSGCKRRLGARPHEGYREEGLRLLM